MEQIMEYIKKKYNTLFEEDFVGFYNFHKLTPITPAHL